MDNEDKNVFKLVQKNKEKPPEESSPRVTPNDLLKEGLDTGYDGLILIGWAGETFRVSWDQSLSPDEVYVLLDLAKNRLMANMYEF